MNLMTSVLAVAALVMSVVSWKLGTRTRRYNVLSRGYLLIAFNQLLVALERERAGGLPEDEYVSLLHSGHWLLQQPDSEMCMTAAVSELFRSTL